MKDLRRSFSLDDQHAFAAYSGDFNPMHVDALYARRLAYGSPVVDGAHLVLWAIESLIDSPQRICALKVKFRYPVRIGEQVRLEARASLPGKDEIAVISQGRVACSVSVESSTGGLWAGGFPACLGNNSHEPRRYEASKIRGACGTMVGGVDHASGARLFPRVSQVAPGLAQTIATTSQLIGMECPGLDYIFSELALRSASTPDLAAGVLEWGVSSYDNRFSRVVIEGRTQDAVLEMAAFVRPDVQSQPSSAELGERVSRHAYAGRRALVVGGSRGLGELCAKLLAAGGADVCITYRNGRHDADVVVADILGARGRARAMRFDVLDAAGNEGGELSDWLPTHLYYFATPPIFVASRHFSGEIFEKFCAYYVTGFVDTVNRFRGPGSLRVFYPSTVAITAPPPDMGEYVAAKAAGEAICRWLSIVHPEITVDIDRLPRLPTDQTATLFPVETEDPIPILRAILDRK